jgi:hypothetical protein
MTTMQSLFNLLATQRNRSSRFSRYLMVQIADEYLMAGDMANCLSYLNQVLPYYKLECWTPLLQSIVFKGLCAAYRSASATDFIRFAFEYLGLWNSAGSSDTTDTRKQAIQRVLNELFVLKCPSDCEFLAEGNQLTDIAQKWSAALQQSIKRTQITFKASNHVADFVQIRCCFARSEVGADERVRLFVYFRSNCPLPLHLTRIKVLFSNEYYNQFGSIELNEAPFDSTTVHRFELCFKPNPTDAQSQIQIVGVGLYFGSDPFLIHCSWILDRGETVQLQRRNALLASSVESSDLQTSAPDQFDQIRHLTSLQVRHKTAKAQLTIHHSPPLFFNENYPWVLNVRNNESGVMQDCIISLRLQRETTAGTGADEFVDQFSVDGQPMDKDFERKRLLYCLKRSLKPQEATDVTIHMQPQVIGKFAVYFTLQYAIELNDEECDAKSKHCYTCETSESIESECLLPFQVTFSVTNPLDREMQSVRLHEPFGLTLAIKPEWSGSLQIASIRMHLNKNFSELNAHELTEGPWDLRNGASLKRFVRLACSVEEPIYVGVGSLWITWRRTDSESRFTYTDNTISVFLPEVYVEPSVLFIEANYPPFGTIKCPMHVKYTLHNRTESPLALQWFIDSGTNFMFSGNKQVSGLPFRNHNRIHLSNPSHPISFFV